MSDSRHKDTITWMKSYIQFNQKDIYIKDKVYSFREIKKR